MIRARRAVPVVVLVAALAGCSGDDGGSGSGGQPSTGSQAGAATPGATASPQPAASLTGLVPGRTIADSAGHKITVFPVTLKRQGKLALLEVAAHNDDAQASTNVALVLRGNSSEFDEVTLVDPDHGKRYLVAKDSKDDCLCTNFFGGVTVAPGETGLLSAYFAAPPDDVSSLNVTMPGAGTFTGVPVS